MGEEMTHRVAFMRFAFLSSITVIVLRSSSRDSFVPQVGLWIFAGKRSRKTRERTGGGFAVIVGVWKVLAALHHHLLNSASAVSSWLEFVAEA